MQLYKITEAMKDIEKMIEDGVPLDQLQDTMDEIKIDFKEKADGCLFAIANMDVSIAGCKAEEERLSKRRKVIESQKERLKEYLLFNMKQLNSGKVDNGVMSASVRKGMPKLGIVDEDLIPIEYKNINTSISIDRKALLDAIKGLEEGDVIPGAEIVQGAETLTIK